MIAWAAWESSVKNRGILHADPMKRSLGNGLLVDGSRALVGLSSKLVSSNVAGKSPHDVPSYKPILDAMIDD